MRISEAIKTLHLCEARLAACELTEKIEDPEYREAYKTARNALTYKDKNAAHQKAGEIAARLGDHKRSELHMRAAGAASQVIAKKKGSTQPASIQRRVAKAFMPSIKNHGWAASRYMP